MESPLTCDLTKPFEFYGSWWRSGKGDDRSVPGCLSYTPEHGLQLHLYEALSPQGLLAFKDFLCDVEPEGPLWGELIGFAGQAIPVSLFGDTCTNIPASPSSGPKPPSHEIYHLNHAVVGVHTKDPESLKFQSLSFSVLDFETFVGRSPWRRPELPNNHRSHGMIYTDIDPINCTLATEGLDVAIVSRGRYETSFEDCRHIIAYECSIELTPHQAVSYDIGTDMVATMTRFLALCLRESINRRYIRGVLDSGEAVALYGQPLSKLHQPKHRDWLLKLDDIGADNIGGVLAAWFALEKQLGFTAPVFFTELSSPSRINDARFLHFAGCLEAFHREIIQPEIGKFIPKPDFKKVVEQLLTHIPAEVSEELRASIRSCLSRANDKSFGERLDTLFNSLQPDTQKMLANEPQRFLSAVKHSRNKLAHVTDGIEREMIDGIQYVHANLSIRGWLKILMLRACGLGEELIRSRMDAINYFYWGPFDFENPAERVRGRF